MVQMKPGFPAHPAVACCPLDSWHRYAPLQLRAIPLHRGGWACDSCKVNTRATIPQLDGDSNKSIWNLGIRRAPKFGLLWYDVVMKVRMQCLGLLDWELIVVVIYERAYSRNVMLLGERQVQAGLGKNAFCGHHFSFTWKPYRYLEMPKLCCGF